MISADSLLYKSLTIITLFCVLFGLTVNAVMAAPEAVVLTVKGMTNTNTPIRATYTLAALQAMPKSSISTTTSWTDGLQLFEGVSLKTLLEAHGVTTGTIVATAINEYSTEIPVSDAVIDGPIIAYSLNGAPMTVREKGPLWIVYPYDQHPNYQTEVVYARSIWQLDRIIIAP